jgi:hypothetical protein
MMNIVKYLRSNQEGWHDPDIVWVQVSAARVKEAADEIERLREKCNMQADILRRLNPAAYPDALFIHALLGERDQNNMPEKLLVVPAYGVDFSYVYEKTGKTTGPKW